MTEYQKTNYAESRGICSLIKTVGEKLGAERALRECLPEIFGVAERETGSGAAAWLSQPLSIMAPKAPMGDVIRAAVESVHAPTMSALRRTLALLDRPSNQFLSEKLPVSIASRLGVPSDRIVQINNYINSEGQSAGNYLEQVLTSSDVTIIGEQHTIGNQVNPNTLLGIDVISRLPAGSTLAIERQSYLRPIFEELNDNPGSDLRLDAEAFKSLGLRPTLPTLYPPVS